MLSIFHEVFQHSALEKVESENGSLVECKVQGKHIINFALNLKRN